MDAFVASHDVALAVLAEMQCDATCNCPPGPAKQALWLRGLDPKKPFATRVASGKFNAPAFSLGDKGGVGAWRAGSPPAEELLYVRVGANGRPIGAPVSFAKGDVGAPAVAMSGDAALLVWASRPDKQSNYALSWMKVGETAKTIATKGSAIAPAILADADDVVLAWMEGDLVKSGEIHVARGPVSGPIGASTVVSGAETNARDPELGGTPAHPVIVWSTFPKEQPAGVIRVGQLKCGS